MPDLDLDWRLRLAAFDKLRALREARGGVVTLTELEAGFEFEGARTPLINARRGIWRPKQLSGGPALSVVTVPRRPGRRPPYDDQVASESDWFTYKYEGTDPDEWTNVAVRLAMTLRRPIIYLYGVAPGLYDPIFPCYVVGDDPAHLEFHLSADVPGAQPAPTSPISASSRRDAATPCRP